MLQGLLVDLVPYGRKAMEQDHRWWNNDSMFWASMGERNVATKAEIEREHQEWITSEKPHTGVPFVAQTKDGKPLGYFGINWLDYHHRTANLGASIGEPDYWGGGYGTDALLLIVDYAFDWLDMRKIWLSTMSLNERVLRQMVKVGFTLEARQRQVAWADGQWYDEVSYGLFRDEWPGREAMIGKLGLKARE
jgi:RimJ/RimL family protein N-acetyltransferase